MSQRKVTENHSQEEKELLSKILSGEAEMYLYIDDIPAAEIGLSLNHTPTANFFFLATRLLSSQN